MLAIFTTKTTKKNTKKKNILQQIKNLPILNRKYKNSTPANLLKLWLEGWKKTFTLEGRSSRYELWSFLLINTTLAVIAQIRCCYIFSDKFLQDATTLGYSIDQIENSIRNAEIIFFVVTFLPLIPLCSMLIRRMHDLGELAWKNYLEPAFISATTIGILGIAYNTIENTTYIYIALLIAVCIITLVYAIFFYTGKFLIKTLFYEGDKNNNKYGKALYNDAEHEEQALNFSCLYIIYISTIAVFYFLLATL